MTRLPVVGSDDGDWGSILNSYLDVAHNPDGSLQSSAITNAGGYVKPVSGIAASDLSTGVQADLTAGSTALQASTTIPGGDLTGTYGAPTVAKVNGITVTGTPVSGQVLAATSTTAAAWASLPGASDWINVKAYGAIGDGSNDDTGAIQAAINAVGSNGGIVYFPASTAGYLLNSTALTLATPGTVLHGAGAENTKLLIGSGFSGTAAVQVQAYNCQISDLSINGKSPTTTTNPIGNAITISGVRRTKINRCTFFYINGWAIEAVATTSSSNSNPLGTAIGQIFGQSCAGGIHVVGSATQNYAMNCQVSDAQFYGMGVTSGASADLDAMRIEDSWDVLVENMILWMGAGTGAAYHIKGNSAAQFASNLDVLGSKAGPCVLIEDSSNGSPQNIQIQGGVIQQGTVGLMVTGAAYQVHLATSRIISNQTHGVQVAGTGASINVYNCFFNLNGAGASGTNYDLNWSGSSLGKVFGCSFNTPITATGVAGVQTSVNIAAAQNVMFEGVNFGGAGAASSNWFTNLPSGVLEVGSGVNMATSAVFSASTRAIVSQPSSTSNAAFAVNVSGSDANDRLRISGDGSIHIGPGSAGRDVAIGRAGAGVGYVTNSWLVGAASALGDNGAGELQLANASTVPTTNPTGGIAVYASGGAMYYRNPSGFVHDLSGNSTTSTGATVVTGTTSLTSLAAGATVAANALAAGQVYTLKAWGTLTTSSAADTVTLALYWGGTGGTQLVSWGAQQPNSSAAVTNVNWSVEFEIVANTATSLSTMGRNVLNNTATALTTGVVTVSNTAAKQIVVGVTPSATGVSVTCNGCYCVRTV